MEHQPDPELAAAWKSGQIVIAAVMGEGPSAGDTMFASVARDGMRKLPKEAFRLLKRPGWFFELTAATRRYVRRGLKNLSDKERSDFSLTLIMLSGVMLVLDGDERALEGTGLFSLFFSVNPDKSAPWFERGMLYKEDADRPTFTAMA